MEKKWWEDQNEAEILQQITATYDDLKEALKHKLDRDNQLLSIYDSTAAVIPGKYEIKDSNPVEKLNVSRSIIDTLESKIGKAKPQPLVLPSGGKYSHKHKSRQLNKYIKGQFNATKTYKKGRAVFRDAATMGSGFVKVYSSAGKIKIDRILPQEVLVDPVEGMYGEPLQIMQSKLVPKDVLVELYPDHAATIELHAVKAEDLWHSYAHQNAHRTEMVEIVEAWHLPTTETSKDGKHIIFLPKTVILCENEWTRPQFPIIHLQYTPRPTGYYGVGVCEIIAPLQQELNYYYNRINECINLLGVPLWTAPRNANVEMDAVQINVVGRAVEYDGTIPPTCTIPQAVSSELFNHTETVYRRCYEILGLSQLSAQSQKPAGLNSGKAIRTYLDTESERFQELALSYQDFFLEIAQAMIAEAKDIDEDHEVVLKGDEFFEKVKWSQVDMSDDMYELAMHPVSQLPSSPEGRLAYVQELIQAGMIPQDQALGLLELPDVERYKQRELAQQENMERIVDHIIETGKYIQPEPMDDFVYGINYATKIYAKARIDGAEESILELIRRFLADCERIIRRQEELAIQEELEQQAQMQAQTPQGQPEGPPVSNMIPYQQQ